MAKKVTGIGANPKIVDAHVHVVVKGGEALCDKRTTGLKLNRELTVENVTCSKCKRYSYYKKAIATVEPDKEPPKKTKPKPKPKDPAKVTADATTKAVEEQEAPQEVVDAETTVEPDVIKDEPKELDFIAVSNRKGIFSILHVPSEKQFFDAVPANVIAFALEALNAIETKWKKGEIAPKGHFQLCRQALTQVYKDRKTELPTHLAKPLKTVKKKKPPVPPEGVEKEGDELTIDGLVHYWNGYRMVRKQRRVLKRRPKVEKPKRVLKRRGNIPANRISAIPPTSSKVNELNMLLGKPPAMIYEYLKTGVHYGFLIDEMKHKFSMSDAEAKRKFKTVVRQLTRVNEITVTHLIVANPNLHFYSIDSIAQQATN